MLEKLSSLVDKECGSIRELTKSIWFFRSETETEFNFSHVMLFHFPLSEAVYDRGPI